MAEPRKASPAKLSPRVLLTRDAAGCERWAAELRRLGGRPVTFPCLEVRIEEDPGLAAELASALGRARWLALTSSRGVDAVSRLLELAGDGGLSRAEGLGALRLAAVGPATAARVRERFGRVDLVPETATARGLAEALWRLEGDELGDVVLATADRGRDELEKVLGAHGARVHRFEVYATVPSPPATRRESLLDILRRAPDLAPGLAPDLGAADAVGLDAIALASPSAFEGLRNRAEVPAHLPLVTLGPTTSAAVRRAGAEVAAQARKPTLDALYTAICDSIIRDST